MGIKFEQTHGDTETICSRELAKRVLLFVRGFGGGINNIVVLGRKWVEIRMWVSCEALLQILVPRQGGCVCVFVKEPHQCCHLLGVPKTLWPTSPLFANS